MGLLTHTIVVAHLPFTMKFAALLVAAVAGLASAHDYNENVKHLTNDNFDSTVSEGSYFVKFYAPWCGHCKRLKPTWDDLAKQTAGTHNIGAVDCTVEKDLCSKHGVRGYPTLLYFGGDQSSNGAKYQGGRDINALKSYLDGQQ